MMARPARVSASDVSRRAVELFGDSAATTAASVDSGPSWDIDVHSYESTARVEHYVRLFTGAAKEHIETQLERGTRYEAMIRAKMRDGGLPEDMYYLALVESGFDPNAYSRAAAVGMWQFMTSTARDMGLRVDWWVDERRDPVKSTTAAVRFIKGLKEQFGSLYLAAAAYNGGPGRVARGLTRYADDLEGTSGDDLFFALAEKDYLRNETREYVPQLIAAALIAKEPERYGMIARGVAPLVYDSATRRTSDANGRCRPRCRSAAVRPDGPQPAGTSRHHAAQGLRSFVRLPARRRRQLRCGVRPAARRASGWVIDTVTSKKAETIRSIATREGISTHQLALYNPTLKVLKSGNLAPGQPMLVPTTAVAAAAVAVPDPAIERYGSSRSSDAARREVW